MPDTPTPNHWRASAVSPGGVTYLLFPKGDGGIVVPTLPAGWQFFWPARYSAGSNWHIQWAWGIRVAASATPGDYHITTPTGAVVVTVLAAQSPRPVQYVTRAELASVQSYLNAGKDIEFAPGRYLITAEYHVPDGATISGHGAILVRKFDGAYAQRMFVPSGGMTLEGLTLDHEGVEADGVVYIHNFPYQAGNISVKNCTIRKGELLRGGPFGILVERCRFDKGLSGQVPSGSAWIDNEFYGPTLKGQHSFFVTGSVGSLFASNRFYNTTRGMVFQTGDSVGNVAMDTLFVGVRGGEGNANECLLLEAGTNGEIIPGDGAGIRDNAFIDVWINDCAGPGVVLFGSGMHDNIFWGVDAHVDNTALALVAMQGGTIGKNLFANFQMTGALDLQGRVGGQSFSNCQFIDTPQRRGAQGPFGSVLETFNRGFPIAADDVAKALTYQFSGCGIVTNGREYVPIAKIT